MRVSIVPKISIVKVLRTIGNVDTNFDHESRNRGQYGLEVLSSTDLSIFIELTVQSLPVRQHLAVLPLDRLQAAGRVLKLLLKHLHHIHDGCKAL